MSESNASNDQSDHGDAWYRQLHWQIAIGIVAALVYGIAVRNLWPLTGEEGRDALAI